jgi:acetyl esterase/lipase
MHATAPVIGDGLCTWMWNAYLREPLKDASDPRASPLLDEAVAWSRVPPAVVVTGHFDVLADEGDAYARHLLAHGVTVHAARRLEAHCMNAPDTLEWAFEAARRLVHRQAVAAPPESTRV